MSTRTTLIVDGTTYEVEASGETVTVDGRPFAVSVKGQEVTVNGANFTVELAAGQALVNGIPHALQKAEPEKAGAPQAKPAKARASASDDPGVVKAIMPGKVLRVLVKAGDAVNDGDVVLILEAMKMENELRAHKTGTVKAIHAQPGKDVEMGQALVEIG